MTESSSNFVPIFIVIALQITLVMPSIVLGYTLLTPYLAINNLFYHYIISGILGLTVGLISIIIINTKFNISRKAINHYGASAGLFGMLVVLYSSWLISSMGSWPYETIIANTLSPGSPINTWIAAFVYYMLFNTPFVYLYFYVKQTSRRK